MAVESVIGVKYTAYVSAPLTALQVNTGRRLAVEPEGF
jgi:hypothetical protein